MSDPLSVRRVMVQTINQWGEPVGEPSFGVLASSNTAQAYNDTFGSLEELNTAIDEAGCILAVADEIGEVFPEANRNIIGTENYYGKDWR